MVFRIALILTMCIVSSSVAQGPIIEIPSGVNMDNVNCWLYEMGVQDLTSTNCNRTCVANAAPRVCVYNFVLENYHTMGSACGNCSQGVLQDCMHEQCIPADGTERGVKSINRRRIGPDIQVCVRDLLVITVINRMGGTESTIHWHGILQKSTPHMDGVPQVTQCGIAESRKFRYIFPVSEPGTYFYHSHTGHHKTDGHNGALIVRQPKSLDPVRNFYSADRPAHVVVITDFMHDNAEMFFPGLPTREPGIVPLSFLLNGLGRWRNPATNQTTRSPLATFHVQSGGTYRFRFINACSMICGIQIQIQNHTMSVISTDGSDVQPQIVNTLVSFPGERYDVVINTFPVQKTGAYWIHVTGLGVCAATDRIDQVAVLSYGTVEGTLGIYPTTPEPTMDSPLPIGVRLNHPDAACTVSNSEICTSQLQGIVNNNALLTDTNILRKDVTFGYWEWTVAALHGTAANPSREYYPFQLRPPGRLESGVVNGITNEFPETATLCDRAGFGNYCNQQDRPAECTANGFCMCTNMEVLPFGSNIEMTIRDINPFVPTDARVSHPIHLHGYKFYIMETVRFNETLQMTRSQSPNQIPPLKDTILVPQGGSARIRFFTDNPGDWLFHCHFEWHLAIGMSAIFRVQGPIPAPPPDFQSCCGNFDPISIHSCPALYGLFG